jgi:hypothetical protein
MNDIIKKYNLLIELQTIKSPMAVQGLKVKLEQWLVILNKVNNSKKLTKFENTCIDRIESINKSLDEYIKLVS